MEKLHNIKTGDYNLLIKKLRDRGIAIYGNFLFGYDYDDERILKKTLEFAIENKLSLVDFPILVPFPETTVYKKLLFEGRLVYNKWWLEENYKVDDIVFRPLLLSPEELRNKIKENVCKFYSWWSLLKRIEFKANCKNVYATNMFLKYNIINILITTNILKNLHRKAIKLLRRYQR